MASCLFTRRSLQPLSSCSWTTGTLPALRSKSHVHYEPGQKPRQGGSDTLSYCLPRLLQGKGLSEARQEHALVQETLPELPLLRLKAPHAGLFWEY